MMIPCPTRRPLRVTKCSPHLALASRLFSGIEALQAASKELLGQLGGAFDRHDFDAIFRTRVDIDLPLGGTTSVELNTTNMQLVTITPGVQEFAAGYEPEIAAVVDYFVGDQGTFVDIGANFGYFALLLATRPGFAGVIHAFEPSPRSFEDMRGLVAGAGLGGVVHAHQLALGRQAAEMDLIVPLMDGASTLASTEIAKVTQGVATARVRVERFDELKITNIDVIKIDVEGAEADVLAGAAESLAASQPVVVFESWRLGDGQLGDADVFKQLETLGYGFYFPCWVHRDGTMLTTTAAEAGDISQLQLLRFAAELRRVLPERINVVAMPPARAARIGEDVWLSAS